MNSRAGDAHTSQSGIPNPDRPGAGPESFNAYGTTGADRHGRATFATVVDDDFLHPRVSVRSTSFIGLRTEQSDELAGPAFASSASASRPQAARAATQPLDVSQRAIADMARTQAGSGSLPADDGMGALRRKIHEIREMATSSEEKAKLLHFLMTESYLSTHPQLAARAQSPASMMSGDRPFTPTSPGSVGELP
ncbi:MAG: hypothetical protein INR71_16435, partial [Terriglobus roseus]|nr:hypothetical protein [Terriglobus roseus]